MRMRTVFLSLCIFFLFIQVRTIARQTDSVVLKIATGNLYGTLTVPAASGPVPVVLMIAGSGPTDRDGNNPMMKNNSLKFLGEGLNQQGIATLRYDKRGIAASQQPGAKEANLRFDMLVDDAVALVQSLKADKRFSKVIILGHSEGSTIGLSAAGREAVAGLISIAGPGRSADKVLKEQLSTQPPEIAGITGRMIDTLAKGDTLHNVPKMYYALFRPSIQPYLISWFKYDPVVMISKLTMPLLILQGTTDLQVKVADAELLAKAGSKATLKIIDRMNHVLKQSEADQKQNLATYIEPTIPVVPELITSVVSFIKQLP